MDHEQTMGVSSRVLDQKQLPQFHQLRARKLWARHEKYARLSAKTSFFSFNVLSIWVPGHNSVPSNVTMFFTTALRYGLYVTKGITQFYLPPTYETYLPLHNKSRKSRDLESGADAGLLLIRSGFCEPGVMYIGDQLNCCGTVLTAVTVDVELTSAVGVVVDVGRVLPRTSCSASSSVGVARLRLVSVAPEHDSMHLFYWNCCT